MAITVSRVAEIEQVAGVLGEDESERDIKREREKRNKI